MDLKKDDVAVITGAGSGIGLATARRFGVAGLRVVIADVNATAAAEAASTLSKEGITALGVAVDVTSPEQMDALRDQVLDTYGTVTVVMNNAGIGSCGRVWELSPEVWRASVEVNVLGVVNGMRAFAPTLIEANRGHIVNTASMAGLVARPLWSPYVATKFAVAGLTEAAFHEMAEVAPQVGVSLLCPGPVSTDFLRPADVAGSEGSGVDKDVLDTATTAHEMTVAKGIATSEVAEAVFGAVRDNRFYVLSHPEMADQAAVRAQDIVAGRAPTLQ